MMKRREFRMFVVILLLKLPECIIESERVERAVLCNTSCDFTAMYVYGMSPVLKLSS
jgi:hypothetical protein